MCDRYFKVHTTYPFSFFSQLNSDNFQDDNAPSKNYSIFQIPMLLNSYKGPIRPIRYKLQSTGQHFQNAVDIYKKHQTFFVFYFLPPSVPPFILFCSFLPSFLKTDTAINLPSIRQQTTSKDTGKQRQKPPLETDCTVSALFSFMRGFLIIEKKRSPFS